MSDINFLTWNVQDADVKNKKISAADRQVLLQRKNQLYADLLIELNQRQIDVLVLQECFRESGLPTLVGYREVKALVETAKHGLRVLLREGAGLQTSFVERLDTHRALCIRIERNDGVAFNLIGVHLYSKAKPDRETQDDANYDFPGLLTQYEGIVGNKDSIVVGDLNHSPFDNFLIGPKRLNAVGDKDLITRLGSRQYQRRKWEFLYNPMWNLLGDADEQVPNVGLRPKRGGSYFSSAKGATHHYWNLLDGVLLRKELMHKLATDSLRVVETINGQPLLAQHPQQGWVRTGYSDHLPVVFTLIF